MDEALMLVALGLAGLSATRSTWSPCGLSMLSSITPFSERGRGHRYRWTAAWFVTGGLVGGACLGALAAALAELIGLTGLTSHPAVVASLIVPLAVAGAGIDAGVFGQVLPLLRRQVNDGWLATYRPWLYGAGFGWQLGFGFATYLMTAGVVVLVGCALLTGSPLAAFLIATGFGVARGLTVLFTVRCQTPGALRTLHRRLDGIREPVRWSTAAAQALTALALAVVALGWRPVGRVPTGLEVVLAILIPAAVGVVVIVVSDALVTRIPASVRAGEGERLRRTEARSG